MASAHDFAHALSPASAAMFERNISWLKQREARQSEILRALLTAEAQGMQTSPRLSNKSEMLATKRASVDVVTRLFHDHDTIKASKAALAAEIQAQEVLGVPAITRYAAELRREGPVAERLYAEAQTLKKKKADLVSNLLLQEREAVAPIPQSRRASLTGIYKSIPAHTTEQLYRGYFDQKKRREEAQLALDREARESARPALNAHSLEIAAAIPREKLSRMYKKDIEGLVASGNRPAKGGEEQLPEGTTFHPRIEPRSVALAAKRNGADSKPVEERLYKDAVTSKESKLRELARVQAELEMQGCTFFPNTDPRPTRLPFSPGKESSSPRNKSGMGSALQSSQRHVQGSLSPRHVVRSSEFVQQFKRQSAWLSEREKKLEEARRDKASTELQGCTFVPVLGPAGRKAVRRASMDASATGRGTDMLMALAGEGGRTRARRQSLPGRVVTSGLGVNAEAGSADALVGAIPGINKFAARLEKARELQYEKQHPFWVPDGSKWTGHTTAHGPTLFTGSRVTSSTPSTAFPAASFSGLKAQRPSSARPGVTVHVRGMSASRVQDAGPAASMARAALGSARSPSSAAAASLAAGGPALARALAAEQAQAAPAAHVPRKSPEDIIQETIARSLGKLVNGPTSGPMQGAGAQSLPNAGGEMATAEDIRARLKAIEYMRGGHLGASASAGGTQLRTTLMTGQGAGSGTTSAFSRVGDFAKAEPPHIRFPQPRAASPTNPYPNDPLMARVEAMAAAAANARPSRPGQ